MGLRSLLQLCMLMLSRSNNCVFSSLGVTNGILQLAVWRYRAELCNVRLNNPPLLDKLRGGCLLL